MSEPAGWYTNPDGTDSERFWDGTRWTHEVRPTPGRLLPPPPEHHRSVAQEHPALSDRPVAHDPWAPGAHQVAQPGLPGPEYLAGQERSPGPGLLPDPPAMVDLTTRPEATRAMPDPNVGPEAPPIGSMTVDVTADGAPRSGLIGDVMASVFDLSLERRPSRAQAASLYRVGAAGTALVVVLLMLLGVLAGGVSALVSLVLWPVVGLVSLVHLRATLEAVAGPGGGVDGAEEVDGVDPVDLGAPAGAPVAGDERV